MIEVHRGALRAVVARVEFDRATVEDVVEDVFELAFRRIDHLAGLSPAEQRGWLVGAARNIGSNVGRRDGVRRRAMQRLSRERMSMVASPEDEFFEFQQQRDETERAAVLLSLFNDMRPQHRKVLVLHALGYNGPTMARTLGVHPDAARAQLTRARRALRELYAGQVDDSPEEAG